METGEALRVVGVAVVVNRRGPDDCFAAGAILETYGKKTEMSNGPVKILIHIT